MSIISPFVKDDLTCLTIKDKLQILCAVNPISALIEIVNCKYKINHNMLLQDINSTTMQIYDGNELVKVDTDAALSLLIETRISDLKKIISDLSDHLRETFINDINKYLDEGCYIDPNFRKTPCKPNHILKSTSKFRD